LILAIQFSPTTQTQVFTDSLSELNWTSKTPDSNLIAFITS